MADEAGLEVELPSGEVGPYVARRTLRDWCAGRVNVDLLQDAEVLVSELATNAVQHGQGQITLRASVDQDRLLVEVIDEGCGLERDLRRKDFWQIAGWGLDIVDGVCSRWGVYGETTHVWFELERRGPRLREPDRTAGD